MINNPENGHNPEIRDTEADPPQDAHLVTAVAEPEAQTSQPGETRPEEPVASRPEMSSRTEPSKTGSPSTAQAAGNEPMASAELPEATEPVSQPEFSSEITKFRHAFEEIQAEFIGEPRAAVEKAETLIEGLMKALHDQLQHIHGNVESATDTEHLRVAMLGYRELFNSLGGHRAA